MTDGASSPTVALAAHRLDAPLERMTGLGRYLVGLTGALVARGTVDVLLAAPTDDGPVAPAWAPVPVVRVGGGRRRTLASWALAGRPRLDRLLPGLDLVHVVDGVAPVPAAVPTVYTIHDLFPVERPEWSPRRGALLFRAVLRALPAASAVLVPSVVVADRLAAVADVDRRRIVVVPEGVDDRFREADGARPPFGLASGGYWLALGGAVPRKDLATVVRALAGTRPELPLVVVGPERRAGTDLPALAAELGVADRVRFVGFVPDAELPALIAGARALLHPALDEGFGLPPLEAMAAGTPVVAAATGAVPEVVGGAGRLLAPGDVPAWAATMDELAGDDATCRELRDRGAARASRFTWDATAARTEEVYARCLGD